MMLVLLVLCSGFFQCTLANRLQVFQFDPSSSDRLENGPAVQFCKSQSMSLVTLYDEGDADFVLNVTDEYNVWLGLHQHQHNISSWSNNETVIFNLSNVTQSDRDDQRCEAIKNGSWIDKDCSERLAFMCYKGNSSYNISYTLIGNRKNWCQARQFCRRHYNDLVSISSKKQNEDVKKKGRGGTFWIGLRHDRWKWEDNGCSAYRNWKTGNFYEPRKFTSMGWGSNKMNKVDSGSEQQIICSKGKVRIIRQHRLLTWQEAFDYCNSHHTSLLWIENAGDQEAVQKRLQHPEFDNHFWIGLRQSRVFGFWIWISDRMVSYSNWENGTQPKQPLSHQCGAISGSTYKWTDKNCLLKLPFLCEEEISFMDP